jgi:hypothetical protein
MLHILSGKQNFYQVSCQGDRVSCQFYFFSNSISLRKQTKKNERCSFLYLFFREDWQICEFHNHNILRLANQFCQPLFFLCFLIFALNLKSFNKTKLYKYNEKAKQNGKNIQFSKKKVWYDQLD